MNTKKVLFSFLYTLILIVLGVQAVSTIYQTGHLLNHSRQTKNLELKRLELTKQHQYLQAKLSTNLSLAQLEKSDIINDYKVISQPIVVETTDTIASR